MDVFKHKLKLVFELEMLERIPNEMPMLCSNDFISDHSKGKRGCKCRPLPASCGANFRQSLHKKTKNKNNFATCRLRGTTWLANTIRRKNVGKNILRWIYVTFFSDGPLHYVARNYIIRRINVGKKYFALNLYFTIFFGRPLGLRVKNLGLMNVKLNIVPLLKSRENI